MLDWKPAGQAPATSASDAPSKPQDRLTETDVVRQINALLARFERENDRYVHAIELTQFVSHTIGTGATAVRTVQIVSEPVVRVWG